MIGPLDQGSQPGDPGPARPAQLVEPPAQVWQPYEAVTSGAVEGLLQLLQAEPRGDVEQRAGGRRDRNGSIEVDVDGQ